MSTHPARPLDFEVLALSSGLFDTLPPPKPLFGRAIDHAVLSLENGLFDTLPPPPSLKQLHDSLAPVVEAELRGEEPLPVRPQRWTATMIGACAGIALMGLGLGLRHGEAPAAAAAAMTAPRPLPTIELPEILIVGEPAAASPALRVAAPASRRGVATPRVAAPQPAMMPDDLAVALAAAPPTRELDQALAARAIAGAARSAGACTETEDARTTMTASVTFAPSGRVTSARITGGPFLGTAIGGCVARSLRAASVAPFAGVPVTVNATVRIR